MADRGDAKQAMRRAEGLVAQARLVASLPAAYQERASTGWAALRTAAATGALREIPVARLRETAKGLRIGDIEAHGVRTVADVLDRGQVGLELIPGIGAETARKCIAAAHQIRDASSQVAKVQFDVTARPADQAQVLDDVRRYGWAADLAREAQPAVAWADQLPPVAQAASLAAKGWSRRLFAGGRQRAAAEQAVAELERLLADPAAAQLDVLFGRARAIELAVRPPAEVWQDYEGYAAQLLGLLGELSGTSATEQQSSYGDLTQDIVERVTGQELDRTLLKASLRGYQAFGAKFALAQQRIVLGDEMGLGKTIEALAVLCHLTSRGQGAALVVCPASVVANWRNEVARHTQLRSHVIHGATKEAEFAAWEAEGGVGITTFDALKSLPDPAPLQADPALRLPILVVDEAHYVKNAGTQRSRAVARWAGRSERVLFLSGTPMENRVDEFKVLVGMLQPQVAAGLSGAQGVAGAAAFRSAVAPAYLRRNQVDVLDELPEKIESLDWVDPTDDDLAAYRHAVASDQFMLIRRAAFLSARTDGAALTMAQVERSAKLDRLVDLIEEAAQDGLKVIVFSFFRDVLALVTEAARLVCPTTTFGPVTGDVPPQERQNLVDALTNASGAAVLTAQIEAGGTGLNIQAASVVILCEPQWKPTIEAQAVARAHRMGQVRRVQVHRLLTPSSVDEHMLRILAGKSELFSHYVTKSAITELTPEAIDVSDLAAVEQVVANQAQLERQILESERSRLGLAPPTDAAPAAATATPSADAVQDAASASAPREAPPTA